MAIDGKISQTIHDLQTNTIDLQPWFDQNNNQKQKIT